MVKIKNNDPLDFSEVMGKISSFEGVNTNRALARALKIGETDLSNRRKRGAIPYPHIIEWALRRRVSLDQVLTNRESMERRAELSSWLEELVPSLLALPSPGQERLKTWLEGYLACLEDVESGEKVGGDGSGPNASAESGA